MNGEGKLRIKLVRTGNPSYDWHSFDGQVMDTPKREIEANGFRVSRRSGRPYSKHGNPNWNRRLKPQTERGGTGTSSGRDCRHGPQLTGPSSQLSADRGQAQRQR